MVKIDMQTDKSVLTPDKPVKQVIVYTVGCGVNRVTEDKLGRMHITVRADGE